MTVGHGGHAAEAVTLAEQATETALARLDQRHVRTPPVADLPAPLKWLGAAAMAALTAGTVGMCIWVVATLSSLQQAVTRIDERQQLTTTDRGEMRVRLDRIEERLARLEQQRSGQ